MLCPARSALIESYDLDEIKELMDELNQDQSHEIERLFKNSDEITASHFDIKMVDDRIVIEQDDDYIFLDRHDRSPAF